MLKKYEPARAGSKHFQIVALSLIHERGELLKLLRRQIFGEKGDAKRVPGGHWPPAWRRGRNMTSRPPAVGRTPKKRPGHRVEGRRQAGASVVGTMLLQNSHAVSRPDYKSISAARTRSGRLARR